MEAPAAFHVFAVNNDNLNFSYNKNSLQTHTTLLPQNYYIPFKLKWW